MDGAKNKNAMKLKKILSGLAIQVIVTAILIKAGMEISSTQQLIAGVIFVCLSFALNRYLDE